MELEDLKKEQEAKMRNLANQFHNMFTSPDGAKVLEHLVNQFIMNNEVSLNATNINYESAYRAGEAGVVKYILNQLKRAKSL
jgi:hypothetical protein